MNAHNDVKRFEQGLDARLVLATVQLRVVARVDLLVARWLARCAVNVQAAQVLFPDRKHMPWSGHAVRQRPMKL
jgi:hypothetical protein